MIACVTDDAVEVEACPHVWPIRLHNSLLDARHTSHGRVLAVDVVGGTVTLDVRYKEETSEGCCYFPKSPYPPLKIPIPTQMPAWCMQVGASFEYIYIEGANRRKDFETNPLAMQNFGVPFLWWATTDELVRWLDTHDPMTGVERAAIMMREPVVYVPAREDVDKARLQMRQWLRQQHAMGGVGYGL